MKIMMMMMIMIMMDDNDGDSSQDRWENLTLFNVSCIDRVV